MFNFIGNGPIRNTVPPFDLTMYRQYRIKSVLDSDLYEAKAINNRLRRVGESKSGSSNYVKERLELMGFVIQRWQFNPLASDRELARIVRDKQKYASKSGDTFMMTDGNIGDDMPAELAFDAANHAENIDSIERNYKFLIKGVSKLTDTVDNDSRSGIAMKTLYTTWLHMVNDESIKNFIKPMGERAVGNTYANKMGPNKLVNKYTSQGTGGATLQDQLKESLEAYIFANSGDKGVQYRYDTFMRDLLSLFNTSLGCGILTSKDEYNEIDIEEELKEMEKRFPNGKFTEEFINATTTLEDWDLFQPEDLENEFGIKEYTMDTAVGGSLLEPVDGKKEIELVAEEDSLKLAKLNSHLKQGKESKYYDKIFRERINTLKRDEEKYKLAVEIERTIIDLLPEFLESRKRDAMGFGTSLNKEMITLGKNRKPEVDDDTVRYLQKAYRERLLELARNMDRTYRENDWSVGVLQEMNSVSKIREELVGTLKFNNEVITIMDKELDLDLRFENQSSLDNQFTAMTKNFLIITTESFIIPIMEYDENAKGYVLNVKESIARDRG